MKYNDSFRFISRDSALYWLIAILIELCIFWPFTARAEGLRLEAGAGTCHAHTPPENLWHQNDQPNHMQMRDRCGEVGLLIPSRFENVNLLVRYANLGRYAIQARAIADDNDDFTRRGKVSTDPRRAECAGGFHADCLYNWNGSGDANGMLFGVAYEPLHFGALHIGAEVGLFVYRATWREIIGPIDCPGNQCWQMQIDQRTGWQRAPELGVTARAGYFYAGVRRYDVPTHAPITPGFKAPIMQFVLGVSVLSAVLLGLLNMRVYRNSVSDR